MKSMPDLLFLIFGIVVGFIGLLIMGGEIYTFFTCKEKLNAKILGFKTQKTAFVVQLFAYTVLLLRSSWTEKPIKAHRRFLPCVLTSTSSMTQWRYS